MSLVPARQLRSFHFLDGAYIDEPIFVIGNGPSLNKQDLSLLDGFITIGTNEIHRTYFPSFWIGLDKKQMAIALRVLDWSTWLFMRDEYVLNNTGRTDGMVEVHGKGELVVYDVHSGPVCSNDYKYGLRGSASSALVATNAAFIMGGDPIIFVGLDLSTPDPNHSHFYEGRQLPHTKKQLRKGYDILTGEPLWTNHAMYRMLELFRAFQPIAKAAEIRVYNATEGGLLDVYPRTTLKEVCERFSSRRGKWKHPSEIETECVGEAYYKVKQIP